MRPEETASIAPGEASTLSERAKAQAVPVGTAVTIAAVLGLFFADQQLLALGIAVTALGALEAFIWADTRGLTGFKRILAMVGFVLVLPFGVVATVAILLGLTLMLNLIRLALLMALLALLIWGLSSLPFHTVRTVLQWRGRSNERGKEGANSA